MENIDFHVRSFNYNGISITIFADIGMNDDNIEYFYNTDTIKIFNAIVVFYKATNSFLAVGDEVYMPNEDDYKIVFRVIECKNDLLRIKFYVSNI